MKYTSITRNFRGFNYQSDWDKVEDWEAVIKDQITDNDEIEWSILIVEAYGIPFKRYARGVGITNFK